MSERFIDNSERDARVPGDVLQIIDLAYQTEDYNVMTNVNEAIIAFNNELEREFTRPILKQSFVWHKLCGSGVEGLLDSVDPKTITQIDEKIITFVREKLSKLIEVV